MSRVYIGVGHGGADPGAVKYIVEKEYTFKTAIELKSILEGRGVECLLSRKGDYETDLNDKIRHCNSFNPDLVIDIHYNAGGGTGFEIYYSRVGGTGKVLAENINAEMSRLMKSRGIKTKLGDGGADYFAIIRETNAPAVLAEGGFVDTESDAAFIRDKYKAIAKAYADGICKTLGITQTADKAPEPVSGKLYKVQCGAFSIKENAEKRLDEVKKAGFSDAYIVESSK